MNLRRAWGVATLVLALAALAPVPAEPDAKTSVGTVDLNGLRLPDLDGNTVTLASKLGQGPIVLDFWATWCKPCLAALPELNALHEEFAPRGLQVIGINEDGQRNAAKVKPFVKTHGFEFPVLLDLNRETQSRMNVAVLPTTLLLDSKGKVVHTIFGFRQGEIAALRAQIETLLAETPKE